MARPAGTPQPRPRPAVASGNRQKLYGYVLPELHEKARTAAYSAGMSIGAYLERLIAADELDSDGRPLWAPHATEGEELPLAM